MANRDGDKQRQPPSATDGEFCFELIWWKGIKLTAKGMDVPAYKAMLSATLRLRSPLFWLLLLVAFTMMILAVFQPGFPTW